MIPALLTTLCFIFSGKAQAQPVPGGTLDPTNVPKYVDTLVIPPAMPSTTNQDYYEIAVRQFQQQILPTNFYKTTA